MSLVAPGRTARRFRFAPTPSRELHVGNALAALFGWGAARAQSGAFLLRIEDIDRARCRPELEAALVDDLEWLGLDWDEPIIRQSERLERYDALMQALVARGLAYTCRCSRADIRAAQSAPHLGVHADPARAEVPYRGTCRGHDYTLPADRGGYRFDVDRLGEGAIVAWTDAWRGPQREDVRTTSGDVLLGRPGQPTYQLAVVADDRLTGITDVVRGHDLLGSTARQLLLHEAIAELDGGAAAHAPTYLHHPLLVDAAGHKLSKRDAATSLQSLRSQRLDARALGAALGRAVGLFGPGVQRADARDWADAIATITPASLHDAPWPGTV